MNNEKKQNLIRFQEIRTRGNFRKEDPFNIVKDQLLDPCVSLSITTSQILV